MKKLFFALIAALFISLTGVAQVSESINYQAVARNNAGAALANQTIKVRFTISRNAVSQYSETRQVTTNALGLFNVQIGSAGALSSTGTFSAIDWKNNTPNMLLKVELDINNTNVFTDMGFQAFSSVPFAFAAETAVEPVNIAGRPIDQTTTPTVGSRLSWNGTSWTPVKKDTVYNINHSGLPFNLNASASWRFLQTNGIQSITLSGNERVNISLSSSVFYQGSAINNFQVAVCYQLADLSGPVTPFANIGTTMGAIPGDSGNGRYTGVSASGAITLPAGTYIFGLAIRNNTDVFTATSYTNGTIEIKY